MHYHAYKLNQLCMLVRDIFTIFPLALEQASSLVMELVLVKDVLLLD